MQAEEEYLHMFWPMTSTLSNTLSAPHPLFLAAPQQRLTYTQVWPASQLGPPPLMPLTQPAPSAPFPVHPLQLQPQSHCQRYHHSTLVNTWQLGPNAQLLSSPCATVPDRLPTGPMAILPAVLLRSTGSQ